jgi:serine/threonine protein kinase
MLPSGIRLGSYEVISPLGAEGMGEVYRARDSRLGRHVAVNVLPVSASSDPGGLRRFEREARAASALEQPNVRAVHGVGFQKGAPYVVSELLEGESLGRRLNEGAFPLRKAMDFLLQIARDASRRPTSGVVARSNASSEVSRQEVHRGVRPPVRLGRN